MLEENKKKEIDQVEEVAKSEKANKFLGIKKKIWIPTLLILILGLSLTLWYLLRKDIPNPDEKNPIVIDVIEDESYTINDMSIIALDESDKGVALDSIFEITIDGSISASRLAKELKVKPDRAFSLLAREGNSQVFDLRFEEPLEEGRMVSIIFDKLTEPFGFAFQTYKPLSVSSVYPGVDKAFVPTNTVIEVYFTRNIDSSIEDYIEIAPAVSGTSEVFNNVYRFTPSDNLQGDTSYTIHVKDGFSQDGEALEAYNSSFTTDYTYYESGQLLYFESNDLLYLEADGPQHIKAYSEILEEGEELTATIYKIDEASYVYDIHNLPISEVEAYLDEQSGSDLVTIVDNLTYQPVGYNQGYLTLTENLGPGLYYFLGEKNGKQAGQLLQVTQYNGYVIADLNQMVVWLQSGGEGSLVADVSYDHKSLGKTSEKGLGTYQIELPQDVYNFVEIATTEDQPLMMPLRTGKYEKRFEEDYWYTTYMDRSVYLPSDQVFLTGFIQHKGGQKIKEVQVQLSNGQSILEEKTVPVSIEGGYEVDFNFEDIYVYGLELRVLINKELLTTEYFGISPFVKPTFTMDFSSSKEVLMMGDTIDLSGDVHYFEGTPIENPKVMVQSDWFVELNKGIYESKLQGDEDGHFTGTFTPYRETTSWQPELVSFYARLDQVDTYYDLVGANTIFFPRDAMTSLDVKASSSGGFDIEFQANEIDITGKEIEAYDPDTYKGAIRPGISLSINIVDVMFEEIYIGQVYDEVMKVTRDEYNYNRVESLVDQVTLKTDAQGKVYYNYPVLEDDHSYEITIVSSDITGRQIIDEAYIGTAYEGGSTIAYDQYAYMEVNAYEHGLGDRVELYVTAGNGPIQGNDKDKMLFIFIQEGIMKTVLSDDPKLSFEFDKDMIPMVIIQGVYFDGRYMNGDTAYKRYVSFDTSERASTIDIVLDKEEYGPGDLVEGRIKIMNELGQPVPGYYNVSVVDEAFFAMYPDYDNPIYEIYQYHYNTAILGEYLASSRFINTSFGAEGGEGGDSSVRSDFRNTAYFMNGIADENGEGTISFKVPDNLTQWRVTVTSVSDQLYVGKETSKLQVSKDFFITTFNAQTYLQGDQIGITLKSATGEGPNDGAMVYVVSLKDAKGSEKTFDLDSTVGAYAYVDLGVLDLGTYEMTVTGTYGSLTDALQVPIEVVKSNQHLKLMKSQVLEKATKITHNDQMVHLAFMNPIANERFQMLSNLVYNNEESLEYKTASYLAVNYMKDLDFDVSYITWQREKPYYYIPDNNLYNAIYSSEGSAITTVDLLQMGWGDEIDISEREKIRSGLIWAAMSAKTTYVESAASLYGLALLGEPVLIDIRAALNLPAYRNDSLANLYLIKALSYLGAYQEAIENLSVLYPGAKEAPYLTSIMTDDPFVNKENAILMSIFTDLNQEVYAREIYNQLKELKIKGYSTISETFYYLTHLPTNLLVSSFEMTIDGKVETIELGYNDYIHKDLTADEAANVTFNPLVGTAQITTNYIGTHKDVETTSDFQLQTDVLGGEGPINVGDIVRIKHTITSQKPIPSFRLMEVIPAGLVYVGNAEVASEEVEMLLFENNVGREVEFYTYAYKNEGFPTTYSFTITYEARASAIGVYGYEPSVITAEEAYQVRKNEVKAIEIRK